MNPNPTDLYTFCTHWTYGDCRCFDVAAPDYDENDTRVVGCDCFLVRCHRAIQTLLVTLGGAAPMVAICWEPFSIPLVLAGWFVTGLCLMGYKAIERRKKELRKKMRR